MADLKADEYDEMLDEIVEALDILRLKILERGGFEDLLRTLSAIGVWSFTGLVVKREGFLLYIYLNRGWGWALLQILPLCVFCGACMAESSAQLAQSV